MLTACMPRAPTNATPQVPVTLIYGEHDWMNPAAGAALAAKLDLVRPRKVRRWRRCMLHLSARC